MTDANPSGTGPDDVVLGIETSARHGGAALGRAGTVLAEAALPTGLVHGRAIVAALRDLLDRAEIGVRDLARVAVDVGPGSHTGLRVGIMAAKAIAWSIDRPVVAVDANLALASQVEADAVGDRAFVTAIDARASGVFGGIRNRDGWAVEPALRKPEELAATAPADARVIGTGAVRVVDASAGRLAAGSEHESVIRAATIAILGATLPTTSALDLRARYFR